MAKSSVGVWGIDLGQCALKALRLQEVNGQLTATAFDYVEYPKILSQPDADPDQLTREALEQFLSRNTLKGDTVAIAVPGQSGLARFVKLPPVEEKKIADIVRFEAKQQIPFNLDEVVWDYQKLGSGEVIEGLALDTEIGLFAMKRDVVSRFMQHFKDVKVEVHVIQMAPLSLCNYIAYDLLARDANSPGDGNKSSVVGLDIGTDSSNLVVTDGGRIIWQRPIPLGGNHFTRALTKDMKLTFAKAEHLKRNATKSGQMELKKILASLKPVLNDFVGEVQRSLGYFTNTHRDAQIEYMVGLGNAFRLPGMQRFLSEKLQLEVRKVDKMNRLVGDTVMSAPIFQENMLSFGVSYGLCLQGLKHARLITNLLPPEIRLERLVKAKKPWAVAAAGVMLVGLGSAALGNHLTERPYTAETVKAAAKAAETVAQQANAMEVKFKQAQDEARKEEEAVKAIVAGQAERPNWLQLVRFIGDCVPQPDGKNLPEAMQTLYWKQRPNRIGKRVVSGEDAFKLFEARQRAGAKFAENDASDPLPPGIDDLVLFHIESIDTRFCDDLTQFWKIATKDREIGDVQPPDHFKKMPEGTGWVIEVSGFTYHHGKESFIRNTILANIARLGIKNVGDTPAGKVDAVEESAKLEADPINGAVTNKVSHALLWSSRAKATTEPGGFEIIGQGHLDELLNPPQSSSGGMGGMSVGGQQGSSGDAGDGKPVRTAWKGLSSRSGAQQGGNNQSGRGSPPGVTGSSSAGGRPSGAGGPPPSGSSGGPPGNYPGRSSSGSRPGEGKGPMTPGTGGPEGASGANLPPDTHVRTEFVVMFIWKEPTPSDAFRSDSAPK